MLYFTDGGLPTTKYALVYGTAPGKEEFGAENIGSYGTRNYLVEGLKPNTIYYFRIRNDNGCMPGKWSNEISIATDKDFLIPIKFPKRRDKKSEPTPTLKPLPSPTPTIVQDVRNDKDKNKDSLIEKIVKIINDKVEKIKNKITLQETKIITLKVIRITTTSALVTWQTNQKATTKLTLGNNIYTSSDTLTKNHAVKLTNLTPATVYEFVVESKGKTISTATGSFKTKALSTKKPEQPKPTKTPTLTKTPSPTTSKEISPTFNPTPTIMLSISPAIKQLTTITPSPKKMVTPTIEPSITLEPIPTDPFIDLIFPKITSTPTVASEAASSSLETTTPAPTITDTQIPVASTPPVAEVVPAPAQNFITEKAENIPIVGRAFIIINDSHGLIRENFAQTPLVSTIAESTTPVVETTAITSLALIGSNAILTGTSSTATTFSYLKSIGLSFWTSFFRALSQGMILIFSFLSSPFVILHRKKKGKVINAKTNKGVPKALVIFTREDGFLKSCLTNSEGEFNLPKDGNYLVRVEKQKYNLLEIPIKIDKDKLTLSILPLQSEKIAYSKPLSERISSLLKNKILLFFALLLDLISYIFNPTIPILLFTFLVFSHTLQILFAFNQPKTNI